MRLDHIGIEVNDIYKMELFYKKMFGFMETYRYISMNHPGLRTVFLEKDGLRLELLERPENKDLYKNYNRPFHISIEVENVDSEFKRLSDLGAESLKKPRDTGDGYRELVLNDPEGNTVELARRIKKEPVYPVKGVIFDLDGTLIDSEEIYYESDRILMAGYGIDLSREMKNKYVGISAIEMMSELKEIYNLPDSVDELVRKKNDYYLKIAKKKSIIFPEMLKFLKMIKNSGFPTAVASGTSQTILDRLLIVLDLKKYFDAIVSAESVNKGKPAPDIFLKTAKDLGIDPQFFAVVEDSRYGVEAAGRAFMRCIAVPYLQVKPLHESFLTAGLLFENGMTDFQAEKALEWVKNSGL